MNSYDIYDGLGRIRQTQRLSPGGGTIATDTYYNTTGAKRLVNNDYYYFANPDGNLMVPNVAVPSSDQYDYDGAGRVSTVTALAMDNQSLWSTQIAYTGADTATATGTGTDAATTTIVNSEGNVTSRLLYHGATATGTPDTTSYGYDALGQMTSMTDTAGNQWGSFDPAGRQTSATDPDTGANSTVYDSTGRTASSTDALGAVTAYAYDALDRKTSTTVTPAGGTTRTLQTSTYDGEKKGKLSSTTRYNGANYDQAVTTAVSGYNAAYLPKTTTMTLPAAVTGYAGSYTTTRTYTKTGNTSAQVNPAIGGLPAETLYFAYNSFEKPSSIATSTSDTIAGATQYNHLDQIATFLQYDRNVNSSIVDTTGLTQTYFSWDATTGRLANQSATNIAKGVTADLGKTSYTYTPSGKLTARELSYANRPGAPDDYQCYNYDYASRLAAVWTAAAKNCSAAPAPSATSVPGLGGPAPYAQTYTPAGDRSQVKRFDAAGALAATENYTYPTAGQQGAHRLQSMTSTPATGAATTSAFTWDAAGRMTGRAGETLTYTLEGLISSTTGASNLKTNPNPSAAAGTPPAPAARTAGSAGTRYYDAAGNLVALIDGGGTTAVMGSVTAHATPSAVKTATRTYSFDGKTVAQRTAANGAVKLMFILSDTVDTAQTIVQPTNGTALATAITRFTDPAGLARGPTQSATGAGAYSTTPTATTGVGSNAANPTGFGAVNGYIAGLTDTVSNLTHLGARDLDPVLGSFTAPDPVLHTDNASGFTPYAYSANDPINHSDPSGLDWWGDAGNWFHDNAGTIVNVVTAIVVTAVVATLATACVASIVCGIGVAIAAGAIGAAAGYAAGNTVDVALGNKSAPTQQEYWSGMTQAAGWGALGGAAGGVLGALAGKAAPYVGSWINKTVSAANSAPRLIAASQQAAAQSAQVTQSLGNRAAAVNASVGPASAAGSGSRISANQGAGNAFRDAVAAAHPGLLIEQSLTTTAGVRRLDVRTHNRVGIETKVGRTSLTAATRSQIAKDSLLLSDRQVRGIEWDFSRSGVTGKIGPTGPLAKALSKENIPWSLVP